MMGVNITWMKKDSLHLDSYVGEAGTVFLFDAAESGLHAGSVICSSKFG